MFKTFIVGTLATLNSIMTPLGGVPNPGARDYQLVSNYQCRSSRPSFVVMRVEPAGENSIMVSVRGQLCNASGTLEPVQFALVLPADLTDTAFLAKLPVNSSYVVSKLPSLRSETGANDLDQPMTSPGSTSERPSPAASGTRIKLTKRAPSPEGLTPIQLEWLPNENGQVEHAPMTVWLQPAPAAGASNPSAPWARVDFPELNRQFSVPLTVSRELPQTPRR